MIAQVVARIGELLNLDQLDLDAPLMATGMNSLTAVSTARALSDEFDTLMSPTLAFDYPTARLLAHAINATRVGASSVDSASVLPSSVVHSSGQPRAVFIDASVIRMPTCGATFTLAAVAQLVAAGCDAMCEVPTARWQVPHMPSAINASRVRHGSFICNAECLDHVAFDVSPREASAMDPQQRLVLECGYDALHAAAFDRSTLDGKLVGVVLGIVHSEFEQVLLCSPAGRSVYAVTGATHSIAAGRLPYIFGLHGPCVAYDTFCSSTLVATHASLTALQRSECTAALSEGVNLMLLPAFYEVLAVSGMISVGGHCHTFDQRADGYARGEACGAFVLRPPPDARDDPAVASLTLLGGAVRHDGRSASLTAPNGLAQQGLIHAALEDSAILADALALSETHGTGTSLGDPIEASSLVHSVLAARKRAVALAVGGVKANIGHAEATAGMTGLIKLALSLQSCLMAPNAQLRVLNPVLAMTLSGMPCVLSVQLSVPDASRRCGGVSSFGYNGTIAHAILLASPAVKPADGDFCLSVEGAGGGSPLSRSLLALRRRFFPWQECILHPLAPSSAIFHSLPRLRPRPTRTMNEMVALQLHQSTRMAIVQLNDPGNSLALHGALPAPLTSQPPVTSSPDCSPTPYNLLSQSISTPSAPHWARTCDAL
jgi:3-oxoacyl-(acyl-carrier-protein) synthase